MYTYFSLDILRLIDARCSGLRQCQIRIPDSEFDATKPCFKELKTYMEATYTCVQGNRHMTYIENDIHCANNSNI